MPSGVAKNVFQGRLIRFFEIITDTFLKPSFPPVDLSNYILDGMSIYMAKQSYADLLES